MRGIIILALVIILMLFTGWMTWHNNGDHATITIETEKIKQDTSNIIEKGRDTIEQAGEKVKENIN